MKSKYLLPLVAALCSLFAAVNPLLAQNTAFTYQGRLNDGDSPANGTYNLSFTLYDAFSGGVQIGAPITNSATAVSNGLFTVTLDFGANLPGADRWLKINVRTNGNGAFTTLSPRQKITPSPYAIYAASAGSAATAGAVSGGVPAASLTGIIPDARLSNNVARLNAAQTFNGANTFNQDLSINGNLRLQGGLTMRTDLTLTQPTPGLEGAQLTVGDAGASTAWVIDNYGTSPNASLRFFRDNSPGLRLSTNAFIYNNGTLYADGVNNRVGLGTTTPEDALLDIEGDVRINDQRLFLRGGSDRNHGLGWAASLLGQVLDGPWIFGYNGGALGSASPDTVALRWTRSGNVGIGTNAPSAKLEVVGTVKAAAFVGDGAGLTNIPAGAVVGLTAQTAPPGMVLIPAGSFTMGDTLDGLSDAVPVSVTVSAFYMDVNEVTLSQWQSVSFWAGGHGYDIGGADGIAANHPAEMRIWPECVKWCNARSEQAGKTPVYYTDAGLTQVYRTGEVTVYANWAAKGYRLPTEAEWEKAARGGLSGQRFPWGNVINQNLANYSGNTNRYSYDFGPNGFNALGGIGGSFDRTSPVGSFAANGYGLYDMAGNAVEWCWDWYGTPYAGGSDPHGPAGPLSQHVLRGGTWGWDAIYAQCAYRFIGDSVPTLQLTVGFRCVRGL